MTKKELKEYVWIQDNIKELEERLFEIETQATKCTTTLSDMPKGSGTQDKIGNHVVETVAISNMINRELARGRKKMVEIEQAIDGLDEREKRLMRLRYIKGVRWEEICVEMSYSWMQIHRIHADVLRKICGEEE